MRREHVLLFLSTPRPWMSKRLFSSTRRSDNLIHSSYVHSCVCINSTVCVGMCVCVCGYVYVCGCHK